LAFTICLETKLQSLEHVAHINTTCFYKWLENNFLKGLSK
jgi:hypothetical protein